MPDDGARGIDARFFRLVATFEAAAMQQMGRIAHPVTGALGVDLDGARESIEILAMLERTTHGNLNDEERRLLSDALYHLRMHYVAVARAGETHAGRNRRGGGAAPASGEEAGS